MIKGVSSYGCYSELCEQLSALGVPVVPISFVVEPDGYGKLLARACWVGFRVALGTGWVGGV